jgi:hypothetical protein
MTGKTDEANLSGVARLDQCGVGAFSIEDAMRIFETKNLVVLHEVDMIGV